MSQWANEHPELIGTDADPWMMHAGYRDAIRRTQDQDACVECGTWIDPSLGRAACDDCFQEGVD